MLSREMNPGLGRSGRVKPQLECLEDRCCPSATPLTPHLILIDNPSNATNTVLVSDDGHGDVTATIDGSTPTYHGVQSIDIESTTGNDQIKYTLTNPLKQSEQLTLQLGNGNDQVRLDFSKGIRSPRRPASRPAVGVKVRSGGGDSDVAAVFGAINNADLNLTAQPGQRLGPIPGPVQGRSHGHANVNVNVSGGTGVSGVNIAASGAIGGERQPQHQGRRRPQRRHPAT